MDVVIEQLVIENDREEHIAKHNVTIDEVFEVLAGDYLTLTGKLDRSLLVGKTTNDKLITVIVAPRGKANVYGLVTARSVKKKEKGAYQAKFESKEHRNEN